MRLAATIIGGGIATLICLFVSYNEYAYYSNHPYARGPSGEIAAVALGAAVIGALIVWRAVDEYNDHGRHRPEGGF